MHIEIITPEATLFSGEAVAVSVPGNKGTFQILKNHANIVSTLTKGNVVIEPKGEPQVFLNQHFTSQENFYSLAITGGVVEQKNNKIIILAQ